MSAQTSQTATRFVSPKQLATPELYGHIYTEAGIRHLIWNAAPLRDSKGNIIRPGNGLIEAGALIRVGRKILFDLDCFEQWLKSHRVQPGCGPKA